MEWGMDESHPLPYFISYINSRLWPFTPPPKKTRQVIRNIARARCCLWGIDRWMGGWVDGMGGMGGIDGIDGWVE